MKGGGHLAPEDDVGAVVVGCGCGGADDAQQKNGRDGEGGADLEITHGVPPIGGLFGQSAHFVIPTRLFNPMLANGGHSADGKKLRY